MSAPSYTHGWDLVTSPMPKRLHPDDPTIPPAGTRSGRGVLSLLPYLARTLAGCFGCVSSWKGVRSH
jgi:hypothetical protein